MIVPRVISPLNYDNRTFDMLFISIDFCSSCKISEKIYICAYVLFYYTLQPTLLHCTCTYSGSMPVEMYGRSCFNSLCLDRLQVLHIILCGRACMRSAIVSRSYLLDKVYGY